MMATSMSAERVPSEKSGPGNRLSLFSAYAYPGAAPGDILAQGVAYTPGSQGRKLGFYFPLVRIGQGGFTTYVRVSCAGRSSGPMEKGPWYPRFRETLVRNGIVAVVCSDELLFWCQTIMPEARSPLCSSSGT